MRNETDLAKVKRTAHLFLDLDIQLTDYSPMVVSHPFTNSGIVGFRDDDGNISFGNLIENPADLTRWRQQVGEQIDLSETAYEIFLLINKSYYLAFLKYAAPALSDKDLGQMLSSAWILNEMPNQDPNISKGELVNLFHSVSPEYLMDEEEQQQYRDTTGFHFETLTDDPKVKKAVDDILLDFAGEENPRRACNYGLTEAGKQALRDAADPNSPHTYAWFVLTDCGTPAEHLLQGMTLDEAISVYQDCDCREKRIGVTKDSVATVDLARFCDGEQQFFEDHRKLRSFQNDPFIASAVEKLKQELEQTVETQGFELSSPWTESDLQHQEYSQRMLSAISGLTSYAASLSAKGQDDTVGILRELLIDMCWIWEGYDPISETEMPWDEFLTQYMGPFDEAVEQAKRTGNAPGIAPETKEQIFYGIGIHMRELIESCDNMEQTRQWMSLGAIYITTHSHNDVNRWKFSQELVPPVYTLIVVSFTCLEKYSAVVSSTPPRHILMA